MEQNISTKRRVLQISFVITMVLATLFTTRGQALAYVVLPFKWGVTTTYYDPHSLGSGWITIASGGRQQWNNVSPSPFNMQRNDSSTNDVYFGYVDGSGPGLAITGLYCGANWCSSAGQTVTRAVMAIENPPQSSPPVVWYVDSSCMVPSNAVDARGVLTHEFGHFATLSHSQSSNCTGSNPATMCAGIPAGTGGCAYRTLTSDDQSGLNAQYP